MEPSSRNPSYLPIYLYTVLHIVITIIIFIVALTRAPPIFPVLIIALVLFRLLVMKQLVATGNPPLHRCLGLLRRYA